MRDNWSHSGCKPNLPHIFGHFRPTVFPVASRSKFHFAPQLLQFRPASAGLNSADLGFFYHAPIYLCLRSEKKAD